MRDLKSYWQEVRTIQRSLPESVWLVADDSLVQVTAENAARLLHAKSHRLATDVEVSAQQTRELASKRECLEQGLLRQGIRIIAV
jgi:hypothetical protein